MQPSLHSLGSFWTTYVDEPRHLQLTHEQNFPELYKHYIPIRFMPKGESQGVAAANYFAEWLGKAQAQNQALLVVAEYGEGKTAYTYWQARKQWETTKTLGTKAWIPVRFSLAELTKANDGQAFIDKRMAKIEQGAYASWSTLVDTHERVLVFLDGLDEMSGAMDAETVKEHIETLIELIADQFLKCKVVITSRPHILNQPENLQELQTGCNGLDVVLLERLKRDTVRKHLKEQLGSAQNAEGVFAHVANLHDPIGWH